MDLPAEVDLRMHAQALRRRWWACRRMGVPAEDWRSLYADGQRTLAELRGRGAELERLVETVTDRAEHQRVWLRIADVFWISCELEEMLRSIEQMLRSIEGRLDVTGPASLGNRVLGPDLGDGAGAQLRH